MPSVFRSTIDQATGEKLPAVLAARRQRVAVGRWEELVPLGALLGDLGEFDEAEHTYVEGAGGLLGRIAVRACLGVASSSARCGANGTGAGSGARRELVSPRDRLSALLREGAGSSRGDLSRPTAQRRRQGAVRASA